MFNEKTPVQITLEDGGELLFFEQWLSKNAALEVFQTLLSEVPWSQKEITMMGKKVPEPRLNAWFGDPEAEYTYSGLRNVPIPWTSTLSLLRAQVQRDSETSFNSVLANLYRDGNDSMGFHADNEKELGKNPLIASVSLGETRRFQLRYGGKRKNVPDVNLDLPGGSLLVMRGTTQHFYRHGVPKSKKPGWARGASDRPGGPAPQTLSLPFVASDWLEGPAPQAALGPRINLTFRKILKFY